MHESDRVIDEYTLAAYLAGTLPEKRRQDVIACLAANADAREVVYMASEALKAARSDDRLVPGCRMPRRAPQPDAFRLEGIGLYAAAMLIVLAIAFVLHMTLSPTVETVRAPLERDGTELEIRLNPPGPSISWPSIKNAYRYRLVVWDPLHARLVGQYDTSDNELDVGDAVLQEIHGDLKAGHPYSLRIDAIDAYNRLVGSSDAIELKL